MSYYSDCKVNMEDFSDFDKTKTIEQNRVLLKSKEGELKSEIAAIWQRVAITCALKNKYDVDQIAEQSTKFTDHLKILYSKLNNIYIIQFLLGEDPVEGESENTRIYWVNHYENASSLSCKECIEDDIKKYEEYINKYFERVSILMAMDPSTLITGKEDDYSDPVEAITERLDEYKNAIEECFSDRAINLLFLKYPCKNEDEEDWHS